MARKQTPTPASTPTVTRLAKNIKLARRLAGMTQAQLAVALGVTDGMAVSNWERGVFRPSEENLTALCQVLRRDIAWFFTDHGDAKAAA